MFPPGSNMASMPSGFQPGLHNLMGNPNMSAARSYHAPSRRFLLGSFSLLRMNPMSYMQQQMGAMAGTPPRIPMSSPVASLVLLSSPFLP